MHITYEPHHEKTSFSHMQTKVRISLHIAACISMQSDQNLCYSLHNYLWVYPKFVNSCWFLQMSQLCNGSCVVTNLQRQALLWCIAHMSHLMTKPTKWLWAQRRLISAWASAQSDQSSLLRSMGSDGPKLSSCRQRRLIRLDGCPGWSEFAGRTCHFAGFVMRQFISRSSRALLEILWSFEQQLVYHFLIAKTLVQEEINYKRC